MGIFGFLFFFVVGGLVCGVGLTAFYVFEFVKRVPRTPWSYGLGIGSLFAVAAAALYNIAISDAANAIDLEGFGPEWPYSLLCVGASLLVFWVTAAYACYTRQFRPSVDRKADQHIARMRERELQVQLEKESREA